MTTWEPTIAQYYARIRELNKVTLTTGAMQRQLITKQPQLDEWWLKIRLAQSLSDDQRQQLNSFLLTKAYSQLIRLIRANFGGDSIDLTFENTIVQATTENNIGLTYTTYQATKDLKPPKSVVFYLHGGGLIAGATEHQRFFLRYLAQELGGDWQVISIDYPLVPEHSLDESVRLTQELIKELVSASKARNYYLVGEGSGGLLALLVRHINNGISLPPLTGQGLINAQINFDIPHHEGAVKEFNLTIQEQQILMQQLQQEQLYLSLQTMFIKEQITNLNTTKYNPMLITAQTLPVPTLILAAEYDILTPAGVQYWQQLQANQWPVSYIMYGGMVNGFVNNFGILPQAQLLAHDLVGWLHDLEVLNA